MRLEELPVEILRLILTDDDISHVVIDLWKCGSITLNSKLARGAVTDVYLEDTTKAQHNCSRWPKCLKEFNLKRLVIKSKNSALCSLPTLRSELKKLHRDLKALEIRAPGADFAIFGTGKNSTSTDSDDEPRPAKRSKHSETEDFDLLHEELWNLDLTWPSLERLSVKGERYGEGTISSRVFAVLPRSLLHLTLGTSFNHQLRDFSTLPPKLQTLNLYLETLDSKALMLLPKTITDLGKSLDDSAQIKLARNPQLLPNLIDFPFIDDVQMNANLKLYYLYDEPSPNKAWPSNLKLLCFTETDAQDVFGKHAPALPQELLSLELDSSCSEFDIAAKWLIKIPPSLTSLKVASINWKGINASIWPPHLTTLSIEDPSFSPAYFHKLPRSLVTFDMGESVNSSAEPGSFKLSACLHAGLTTLSTLEGDLWNTLKPQLIKQAHLFSNSSATEYIAAVEKGQLFGLPLTLKKLLFTGYDNHHRFSLLVPPQLIELRTPIPATKASARFLELVPPSLTKLTFLQDEQTAGNYHLMIDKCEPGASALSKAMNLRQIHFPDLPANTAKLIKHLPCRELASFDDTMTTDKIRDLPPSLTSLQFGGIRPSNRRLPWVPLLPSTLTHLDIDPGYLLGSEFALLPCSLTSLVANLHKVELSHFWTLPKSLRRIQCGYIAATKTYLPPREVFYVLHSFYNFHRIFAVPQAVVQLEIHEAFKGTRIEEFAEADDYEDDTNAEEPIQQEDEGEESEEEGEENDEDGDEVGEDDANDDEDDADNDYDEEEGGDDDDDDNDNNDEDEDEEDEGDEDDDEALESVNEPTAHTITYPEQTDIDPRTIRRVSGL